MLAAAILDARWPRAPHSLVDGIVAAWPSVRSSLSLSVKKNSRAST
jgi:hypothetical protein